MVVVLSAVQDIDINVGQRNDVPNNFKEIVLLLNYSNVL